jgi:hypothetical protein
LALPVVIPIQYEAATNSKRGCGGVHPHEGGQCPLRLPLIRRIFISKRDKAKILSFTPNSFQESREYHPSIGSIPEIASKVTSVNMYIAVRIGYHSYSGSTTAGI